MKRLVLLLLPCSALALVIGCGAVGDVHIKVDGNGVVRSNPASIVCTSGSKECSGNLGTSYELIAEPSSGSHFDHWEGDDLCIGQNRATIVVGKAPMHEVDCTAVFTADSAANPG